MLENWLLVMYYFGFNIKIGSADGKVDMPLPISDFGQIEYVTQHNLYRQQVYPSGSNIECIIGTNSDLVNIAQLHANRCTTKEDPSILQPSCYRNVGISIHYDSESRTIGDIVSDYLETFRDYYDFETNRCIVDGFQCNSYKQASWHRATEIGCGQAKCSTVDDRADSGYVTVCAYSDKASTSSQPYSAGKSCSLCPKTKDTCLSNLCCGNTVPCLLTEDLTVASKTGKPITSNFVTKTTTRRSVPCVDDPICGNNSQKLCQLRPGKFLSLCKLGCGNCKNDQCYDTPINVYNCTYYAQNNFCTQMPQALVVPEYCPKSCGFCGQANLV